jgi:hypothetical protein
MRRDKLLLRLGGGNDPIKRVSAGPGIFGLLSSYDSEVANFASQSLAEAGGTPMDDDREHLTKVEARAGTTVPKTRYVLAWSLGLTVLVFIALLVIAWRW